MLARNCDLRSLASASCRLLSWISSNSRTFSIVQVGNDTYHVNDLSRLGLGSGFAAFVWRRGPRGGRHNLGYAKTVDQAKAIRAEAPRRGLCVICWSFVLADKLRAAFFRYHHSIAMVSSLSQRLRYSAHFFSNP
jgi:hypothetical protein